jgi:hypothetical protein
MWVDQMTGGSTADRFEKWFLKWEKERQEEEEEEEGELKEHAVGGLRITTHLLPEGKLSLLIRRDASAKK